MNSFQVFKFEFKKRFKGILIFVLVWVFLLALFLSFFEPLKASSGELAKLYDTMPKEFLSAVGKDLDSITNIYGYFTNSISLYLMLSGTMLASFFMVVIIPGEISNKSILFLLSKPISRSRIFVEKYLSIVSLLFVSNILLSIFSMLAVKLFTKETDFNLNFVVIVFAYLFILELFFGTLSLLAGLMFNNSKGILVGIFAIFISYTLKVMSSITKEAEFIKYITPNFYVNLDSLKVDSGFDAKVLVIIALTLVFATVSYYVFQRIDIN